MGNNMNIIIRTCGERTEKRCIELARKQGAVHIVRAYPFGECLRQSFALAQTFPDEFVAMVDADVLLLPYTLREGIAYLRRCHSSVLVLDGVTKDFIMMKKRRAGIHIYRRALLKKAMPYINDKKTKPESHVRKSMARLGHKTVVGKIVFGLHDYEQYYADLWRKAFAQAHKLPRTSRKCRPKWAKLAKLNPDYRVILAANIEGEKYRGGVMIDKNWSGYGAAAGLKKLGLKEKEGMLI